MFEYYSIKYMKGNYLSLLLGLGDDPVIDVQLEICIIKYI